MTTLDTLCHTTKEISAVIGYPAGNPFYSRIPPKLGFQTPSTSGIPRAWSDRQLLALLVYCRGERFASAAIGRVAAQAVYALPQPFVVVSDGRAFAAPTVEAAVAAATGLSSWTLFSIPTLSDHQLVQNALERIPLTGPTDADDLLHLPGALSGSGG